MISKEKLLEQMAGLYQNFKINKSRLSGILKITELYGLKVDSDQDSEKWTVYEAESGNYIPWQTSPKKIQEPIELFIKDWEQIQGKSTPPKKEDLAEKEPLDNLKAGGFEGRPDTNEGPLEEPKAAFTNPTRTPAQKKQPEKKEPEKIDYNDGLEPAALPAITGVGMVRPAVTAAEALAAWQEFQALKRAIIEPSDCQEIEIIDKRTGIKKKYKFIKKSGWRKLAACFNLTIRIMSEVKELTTTGVFLWTIRVICIAPNGREMEGVAKCSSSEKSGSRIEHDVYSTAYTRAVNRAISDLIAAGEVSAEEMEA